MLILLSLYLLLILVKILDSRVRSSAWLRFLFQIWTRAARTSPPPSTLVWTRWVSTTDIKIKMGRDRGEAQSGGTPPGLVRQFNHGFTFLLMKADTSDNGLSNGGGGGSYNGINSVGSGLGGGYSGFKSSGGVYGDLGTIRKPTRLEALPSSGPVKKKSVPLLNTMGTF